MKGGLHSPALLPAPCAIPPLSLPPPHLPEHILKEKGKEIKKSVVVNVLPKTGWACRQTKGWKCDRTEITPGRCERIVGCSLGTMLEMQGTRPKQKALCFHCFPARATRVSAERPIRAKNTKNKA